MIFEITRFELSTTFTLQEPETQAASVVSTLLEQFISRMFEAYWTACCQIHTSLSSGDCVRLPVAREV
jgi:hypothetical protein